MKIAIDFDGTIVRQDHPYNDVTMPLEFMSGAKDGLYALKRAGHTLILWSGRANKALLENPMLDPLARAGACKIDMQRWEESKRVNQARFHQMVDFVEKELPGIFDAIDDGAAGKLSVDLFIDDRAIRFGKGPRSIIWPGIVYLYGDKEVNQK